jgi:hypothetical protein
LGWILNDIHSVFRCLASRPVNPKSRLLECASGSLFELLKDSVTLHDVLSHDVFKSPLFTKLCGQVKAAEDRSANGILQTHQSSEEYWHLAHGLNLVLARTEMLLAWSDNMEDVMLPLCQLHTLTQKNHLIMSTWSFYHRKQMKIPLPIQISNINNEEPLSKVLVLHLNPEYQMFHAQY